MKTLTHFGYSGHHAFRLWCHGGRVWSAGFLFNPFGQYAMVQSWLMGRVELQFFLWPLYVGVVVRDR